MVAKLIRNGTLIDGTGIEPIADGGVLIENGKIVAAGAFASLPNRGDVEEIDAQGGYILPGLIDTHVHVMAEGNGSRRADAKALFLHVLPGDRVSRAHA